MDNQLPAEVAEEIKLSADAFAAGMHPNFPNERDRAAKIFSIGATEYATRLLQAEQESKDKDLFIEMHKVKYNASRALLEKFISRHEAGLLPDRFIYEEIKNFLDGTK